jgi:carboxylesterase
MTMEVADIDYIHETAAPFAIGLDRDEVAVLLHGWTGSPAHFRIMAEVLVAAGYGVSVPLLPGHGTRVEDMVGTGWQHWLEEAATAVDNVAASGRVVHLVGLSMGGLLAILMAPTFAAATITTINAPMKLANRAAWLGKFLRSSSHVRSADALPPPEGEGAGFAHQYHATPVGTLGDVFDLIRAARASLGRVTCPALVVQSRADATVRPISGQIVFDGLGSLDKRLVWLERSRHVATIDTERDLIHEALVAHLRRSGE